MLTPDQDKLHWSSHRNQRGDCGWGFVVRANQWNKLGALGLRYGAGDTPRSDWHKKVFGFAQMLLQRDSELDALGALRKGAYLLAIGKVKSHKAFTDDEFDRVLNMFRLLADPEELRAGLDYNDFQNGVSPGAKRRLRYRIRQAPAAAVQHILIDQLSFYGTKDVDDLPMDKLTALAGKLESWKKSFNRNAEKRQVVTTEGNPF